MYIHSHICLLWRAACLNLFPLVHIQTLCASQTAKTFSFFFVNYVQVLCLQQSPKHNSIFLTTNRAKPGGAKLPAPSPCEVEAKRTGGLRRLRWKEPAPQRRGPCPEPCSINLTWARQSTAGWAHGGQDTWCQAILAHLKGWWGRRRQEAAAHTSRPAREEAAGGALGNPACGFSQKAAAQMPVQITQVSVLTPPLSRWARSRQDSLPACKYLLQTFFTVDGVKRVFHTLKLLNFSVATTRFLFWGSRTIVPRLHNLQKHPLWYFFFFCDLYCSI